MMMSIFPDCLELLYNEITTHDEPCLVYGKAVITTGERTRNRKSPIQDEYIEKYLSEKSLNLVATLDSEQAYTDADFIIVAVPTNYDSKMNFFDTSAVETVISLVQKYAPNAIIVIKSTVPVGYTESVRKKRDLIKLFLVLNSFGKAKHYLIIYTPAGS